MYWQGPSASAYVTYQRAEDALRAIQAVNNIHVDGRTLKASLGTTKYCSHFMKNQQCPKPDCMYLHELGTVKKNLFLEGKIIVIDTSQQIQKKRLVFVHPGPLSSVVARDGLKCYQFFCQVCGLVSNFQLCYCDIACIQ